MPVSRYDSYKLNRSYIYFICALMLLMVGFGVFVAVNTANSPAAATSWPMLLAWCAIFVFVGYYYLRIPVEISFQGEDALVLKTLISSTVVPVRNIISLKATPFKPGFIILKHRDGTIRLLSQITGFYELVSLVKTINPEIEIRGC
jgi:hypothetical protein